MSDYLHPDILSLFLKRLPVNTLLMCRSICKGWKQVIDSQSFITDHLAFQKPRLLAHNQPLKYLLIDPHALPNFRTLRFPIDPIVNGSLYATMIISVHGVICIHFCGALLHLWNPSIRRLSTLTLPSHISKDYSKFFGFWIDPSNNHWKVLIVSCKNRKFYLLSSRKGTWTETSSDVHVDGLGFAPRQVLINGVAYWSAYITRLYGVNYNPDGVLAYFDFMQDKFGTIPMPPKVDYNNNVYKWQDSLALVHWAGFKCELWAMQNGLWSKIFSVRLPDRVIDILYWEPSHSRILAQTDEHHLVMYDPKIRRERIRLRSEFIGRSEFFGAYEFVESLVFPALKCISSD